MRNDKEIATSMRKTGKSYREIKAALKIPLGTLSGWFSNEAWSEEVGEKLRSASQREGTIRLAELNQVRGEHLKRAYRDAAEEARSELGVLKYNPLFIAGLMLYWGEGNKASRHNVAFSNADPDMIRLYVAFLTQGCGIPLVKIKAQALIYPDHDEKITKAFWARYSGIPWENFTKSTRLIGREKARRLSWGVCMVTVSSSYFKVKMLEWLKLLPKELMNREEYATM